MKNILKLTLQIPPSVNHYLMHRPIKKGNKIFVQSTLQPEVRKWKSQAQKTIKEEVEKQGWVVNNPKHLVRVNFTFYFARFGKDSDDYLKIPIDTMNDCDVFAIDDDIVIPHVERFYIDRENPRVEIEVIELENVGVFNSEKEYQEFYDSNCIGCKQQNRCSIRTKILSNEIPTKIDLDNLKCYARKQKAD